MKINENILDNIIKEELIKEGFWQSFKDNYNELSGRETSAQRQARINYQNAQAEAQRAMAANYTRQAKDAEEWNKLRMKQNQVGTYTPLNRKKKGVNYSNGASQILDTDEKQIDIMINQLSTISNFIKVASQSGLFVNNEKQPLLNSRAIGDFGRIMKTLQTIKEYLPTVKGKKNYQQNINTNSTYSGTYEM